MSKEMLVNEITLALLENKDASISEIKNIINQTLSDYSVTKLETTLPSTADGSATRYLFEEFCKCKVAEGIKPSTLKAYHFSIKKFYAWFKRDINLATSSDIISFLDYYRFSGRNGERKANSIKNMYLNLSSVYTWMFNCHYIAENIFATIKTPKGSIPNKEIITKGEMEKITIVCEGFKPKKKERNLAMIDFLADSGVRVSELCNLNVQDVNLSTMTAQITNSKSKQDRVVYFGECTKERLFEYFKYREDITIMNGQAYCEPNTPLFASLRGDKRIQTDGVRRIINEIGAESNINRLHPHLFRATMATNMICNNVSPNVVQKILGHQSLDTMKNYVDLSQAQVRYAISNVI